jgi:hypothetical protein
MARVPRSFPRNSMFMLFERSAPRPRFHVFIKTSTGKWDLWVVSKHPDSVRGFVRLEATFDYVPYDPEFNRIALREAPWPVQQAVVKLKGDVE